MVRTRSGKVLQSQHLDQTPEYEKTKYRTSKRKLSVKNKQVISKFTILINGKAIRVICGEIYQGTLCGYRGLILIKEIWQYQEEWYTKVRFFVQPQHVNNGRQNWVHGQDEVLEFSNFIILTSQQFRLSYQQGVSKEFASIGTKTYTKKDCIFSNENNQEYVQMKTPMYEAAENFSVSVKTEIEQNNSVNAIKPPIFQTHYSSNGKFIIMNFNDYCIFRAWIQAFRTGVKMALSQTTNIITDQSRKVIFSRDMFYSEKIKDNDGITLYIDKGSHRKKKKSEDSQNKNMDKIDDTMYMRLRNVSTIYEDRYANLSKNS